jgi:hypothetical protein
VLHKALLNNHQRYSLIQAGNYDSADPSTFTQQHKLLLAAAVSSCSQSGNCFIAPHAYAAEMFLKCLLSSEPA